MGVGYVEAVYYCLISFNNILCDGVLDLFAVFVLVEILKGPCPAVCFGYYLSVNYSSVCKEVDGDGLGTDSVCVILVYPCLCAVYCNLFGCVGIGDLEAGFRITFNSAHVRSCADLRYGVFDLLTCIIYRKVNKCACELVFCVKNECVLCGLAVCEKSYSYALRSLAVAIVTVVPDLAYVNECCHRLVVVFYLKACFCAIDGRIVVFYSILCNGVYDLFAVFVLIEVLELCSPVIFFVKDLGCDLLTVCVESYCDLVGTERVAVVTVVPCLLNLNECKLGLMYVCYAVLFDHCLIACNCVLGYSVVDNVSALVYYGNIFKCPCPVVFCVENHVVYLSTVCEKSYCYFLGSDTVAIVTVVPCLVYCKLCYVGNCNLCVGINLCHTFSNTDKVLRNLTAGCNAVTV